MSLSDLDVVFAKHLSLDVAPVAVSFSKTAPAGVRAFSGSAPSGCSFWKIAAELPRGKSAFTTVAPDHYNCSIGAYVHRIELPKDRAQELPETLGLMAKIGYLKMEEVAGIPRLPETPGAVVYSRLGDAPVDPDVVIFALKPAAAMQLAEASIAAGVAGSSGPLARPTCMALPAAMAGGTTQSLGCVGNRVYTGLDEGYLYTVVRGPDLGKLAAALETVSSSNAALLQHHESRKQSLTIREGLC